MKHVVFLVEEPSAKDLLEGLLPRLLPPGLAFHFLVFEGKQDLERKVVRRLQGWNVPDSVFVVMRDQDSAPCVTVKQRLVALVRKSGRSALVRVACHELESWVLGDMEALAEAFAKPSIKALSARETFRNPDALAHPVEELRKLLPDYQKRDGARRMGVLLHPDRNQSRSFRVFCKGVVALTASGVV